ncbi:thiamine-monophosphate kinase [Luteolibacter ambystomatis]|uniref:Thiamine-monophosphate kinase n=1 Tax=Luteolibacter ambystomatis TaxID=2824561 RepID=A0A975IZ60_9BACT|nr:thiamine-phosphate kinase [Luteolibacter ambystomatis]QUE50578.1 thiamine-monophosphate kinase [Luteolibacter ambystomatis]
MKKALKDLGEDALIDRLVRLVPRDPDPVTGPGDDCAVIDTGNTRALQLLKTDAMVEHVHFLPDTPPRKIGWKAAARVLSDFAAMGGTPDRFLVTIALPPSWPVARIEGIYRGFGECLARHGGFLAGGETTRVPAGSAAVISIAATGTVVPSHITLRSGGRPGDLVLVTGRLGGSIRGKHLTFTPRLEEAAWLVRHLKPTAMMDLSDGVAKDLPRLAKASGLGFQLDREAVPRTRGCTVEQALGDGEDFELLFTLPPRKWNTRTIAAWNEAFPKLPLTVIGKLSEGAEERLEGGWDHFAK